MTLAAFRARLGELDPVQRTGRVTGVFATYVDADGPNVPLGALCEIEIVEEGKPARVLAEVVRVGDDGITLSLFRDNPSILVDARVKAWRHADRVPVGGWALGHVIDALGDAIDGGRVASAEAFWPLHGRIPSPLDRLSTTPMLETGVRAIDGLLPLAKGQRVGLFAPSGAGKTTLLTQIVQQASAEVTILCLVGERGREVESIWHEGLSLEARTRCVMVAATSDQSAAMRVRAVRTALAHAEYWRAQGKHVLFVLDSATRLAMAMREVGLAAGEPPTVRGYTPSTFAAMPKIIERCGAVRDGGAITAIFTVLSEDEDMDDPICEMMKSLLDGHILLSRTLAEKCQFPAIDILRSVSRQAERIMAPRHLAQTRQVLEWLSVHENSRTLIETGLYAKGTSPLIDQAIGRNADIIRYVTQERTERSDFAATTRQLSTLCETRS